MPEQTIRITQIPIAQRGELAKQTAGSFFGGFRTPARCWSHRLSRPASGTLHNRRREQVQQRAGKLRLLDHLVGAAE